MLRAGLVSIAVLACAIPCEAQVALTAGQLVGVWKCETDPSEAISQFTVTLSADGKEIADATMQIGEPLNLEVSMRGTATWALKDNQFIETPISFKYTGGKKNGRPVAPGFLETVLGEPPVPGEPTVSTIEIDGDVMRQKKSAGKADTRCTRQK